MSTIHDASASAAEVATPRIDAEDRGPVRILTVANPAKRNAFTSTMSRQLRAAFSDADTDPQVRAIVVTGVGQDAFSSGHDLAEVRENPETAGDPEANFAFTQPASLQTPVIAAVNGAAYAAGFILALNADLRVAGSNAAFGAVGARIGLVPVGGQLSRILHTLPYPVAFELLTTAQPMSAQTAAHHGFVTRVTEPAETLDAAVDLGRQIASSSPAVAAAIKVGLNATVATGVTAGQALEPALAAQVQQFSDGEEGVAAFLERRAPAFADLPAGFRFTTEESP